MKRLQSDKKEKVRVKDQRVGGGRAFQSGAHSKFPRAGGLPMKNYIETTRRRQDEWGNEAGERRLLVGEQARERTFPGQETIILYRSAHRDEHHRFREPIMSLWMTQCLQKIGPGTGDDNKTRQPFSPEIPLRNGSAREKDVVKNLGKQGWVKRAPAAGDFAHRARD